MSHDELMELISQRIRKAIANYRIERERIAWFGDGNSKPMGIISGQLPAHNTYKNKHGGRGNFLDIDNQ